MMKLSERMNDYAIEDEKMTDNTIVKQWADEVAKLEAKIEGLMNKAQQVVDGAHGGEFDKFSGHDDYVVPYQLIDELQDVLLTGEKE